MEPVTKVPGTGSVVSRIVLIIILVEAFVMLVLSFLQDPLPSAVEAFVDVVALSLLSAPLVYFWAIKPFVEVSHESAASLEASEQHLLAAQRVARVGSWSLDHRSGQLSWSNEVFNMFDIDPKNTRADYQAFLASIHPDDRDRVDQEFTRSVDEHRLYHVEHRLLLKGGRICHVCERGETTYDQAGAPLRSTGTVLDITSQVEAQKQIEKERRQAQNYLNIANVIMVALDRQGRVTMVNPMCCRLLKMDECDLLGTDWIDNIFVDHEKADMKTLFLEVMDGKGELPEVHENWIVAADGREILVAWHNSLMIDENGAIVGTLSSGQDMTETRQAEQALLQSKQETEQALEQLSDLSLQLQTEIAQRKRFENRMSQMTEIDNLTQLPSRSSGKQRIRQLLEQAGPDSRVGLLSLHLLCFESVNRRFGIDVGDAVVVESALRIQDAVGDRGLVYRSHGVGFVIVLPELAQQAMAQSIAQEVMAAMDQPFESAPDERVGVEIMSRICGCDRDSVDDLFDLGVWRQQDGLTTRLVAGAR
jgi:PAS domain S-box-containing protein/diguanylate cyclase (GGDEF)-like protein